MDWPSFIWGISAGIWIGNGIAWYFRWSGKRMVEKTLRDYDRHLQHEGVEPFPGCDWCGGQSLASRRRP